MNHVTVRIAPGLLLLCCLMLSTSCAGSIVITDTSVSSTSARDGVTLTLGYQITSELDTIASLGAKLIGPNGEVVSSTEADPVVELTDGTHWYYRQFLINLPPMAATGSYDIQWSAVGESGETRVTTQDLLTILPPIPVRVPILMYHNIGAVAWTTYYTQSDMFRKQMQALKAYGYTTVTLHDVMDYRAGIATPPAKPVVLTFDDGYESWYTDVFPILSDPAINFKATFFIPTAKMGGTNAWTVTNGEPVVNMLTWEEIGELHNSPLIDFESHTVNHVNLSDLAANQPSLLPGELAGSKYVLDATLGQNTTFLCYPFGASSPAVWTEARKAGYFAAVNTAGLESTCADKWQIKRIAMRSTTNLDYGTYDFMFGYRGLCDLNAIRPKISFSNIQCIDPATDQPISFGSMTRGKLIKIRLTATNSGLGDEVIAQLSIRCVDKDGVASIVYDSHLATPSADIATSFLYGQRTFEWLWQIPTDAPLGQYSMCDTFTDRFDLVRLHTSGWQSVFALAVDFTIGAMKSWVDGSICSLNDMVVTAVFPDCLYVQKMQNSAYGIRIEMQPGDLTAGRLVGLSGSIQTDESGERYIAASSVVPGGYGTVKPLSMGTYAVGGDTIGRQQGVWQSSPYQGMPGWEPEPNPHLNNLGLLIRTWGKVASFDAPRRTFTVNDGSGVCVKCLLPCDPPPDHNWTYAVVTGISSCENIDGKLFPLLRIRSLDDVVPYGE